jgi:hypothetical protein
MGWDADVIIHIFIHVILHISIYINIYDEVAKYPWRLFFIIENRFGLGYLGLELYCDGLRSSPFTLICDDFEKPSHSSIRDNKDIA